MVSELSSVEVARWAQELRTSRAHTEAALEALVTEQPHSLSDAREISHTAAVLGVGELAIELAEALLVGAVPMSARAPIRRCINRALNQLDGRHKEATDADGSQQSDLVS